MHGLASPLGAFFPIPHGAVCCSLVAAATAVNIDALLAHDPANSALDKYARAGEILCEQRFRSREAAWQGLLELLEQWTQRLALPTLRHYGVTANDFDRIIAQARGNSMKTNPVVLSDSEIHSILNRRL